MPKIVALEIENFQSIKESVRIEFAPITLFFGPNSAGKSAVFDALDLIECIWDPNKFDEVRARQMVERWARKENGKALPLRLAIEFEYEINKAPPGEIFFEPDNWRCRKAREKFGSFWFYDDNFTLDGFEYCGEYSNDMVKDFAEYNQEAQEWIFKKTPVRIEFQISCIKKDYFQNDGDLVPSFNYISIGIRNQKIINYGLLRTDKFPQDDFYNKISIDELVENGLVAELFNTLFTGYELRVNDVVATKDTTVRKFDGESCSAVVYVQCLDLLKISNGQGDYSAKVANNLNDVFFYFGINLGQIFKSSTPLVQADRRVPSPSEALFVVDYRISGSGWWDHSDKFAANSPAQLLSQASTLSDPHYHRIARTAHASLVLNTAQADDVWCSAHNFKYIKRDLMDEVVCVEKINEHLEKHLFNEKLYRVECASTFLVPLDATVEDPWGGYYVMSQPAAVRLYLRDGEGRRVELQDVGSGIPFVLPVLCASAVGILARIQQPELHLHPALQSELADVFLSECIENKDKLFIVETHSEHLMLRLLRRIRDTEKQKPSSRVFPFKPEDLAIYYFDPQVSGGTRVSRQAVTPLGDFYHDWPRGFFADRDKDLFE